MDEYTSWCDEEANEKEDAITSSKRTIGDLEATIADAKATIGSLTSSIDELTSKISSSAGSVMFSIRSPRTESSSTNRCRDQRMPQGDGTRAMNFLFAST